MLISCTRRAAVNSAALTGRRHASLLLVSTPSRFTATLPTRRIGPSVLQLQCYNQLSRARRRSFDGPPYLSVRRFASGQPNVKPKEQEVADADERPSVPSTPRPELSPSPLNLDHLPSPPSAPSMLRAAIADYLAAQQIGDVKTPPAELSLIRRLIFQAKELFWFYWNGLKMVRANYHRAKQLRAGVRDHGWTLNRREELFLRRVDSDMLRLIPFIAVLVILEEILPLLVLYAPWLLPSTCILPTQMLRIKSKEEQKRRDALLEVARTTLQGNPSSGPLSIATLDAPTLKGICQATDLGTVAPAFILRRRLVAHLRWLEEDDALIFKEENGRDMQTEEKRLVLSARGLAALHDPIPALQTRIDRWLAATRRGPDYASNALGAILDEARRIKEEEDEKASREPPRKNDS